MGPSAGIQIANSSISIPCALCGEKGALGGSIPPRFTEVQHFSLQAACIREFKCTHTAAKLFVCNVPSPVCNLYITFKTETHTDEGLPHTLEHLVFLGSKHFPYKGFLDLVASRCLSHGTNAWTATDHTTYTLTTAGSEGLLNLLPIYLDHLLLPTLTDDAFLTEVHHLKRDGSSSGVVYSEMESCERTASCILNSELVARLYPGDSGYKYETGGRMEWIRRTNNQRVQAYHKAFYRWDNMALIVTGCVPATDLLDVFTAAADKIDAAAAAGSVGAAATEAAAGPAAAAAWEEFKKPLALGKDPWSDPVNIQPLLAEEKSAVRFPADDEKTGRVAVAWRGPPWNAFTDREALDIIGYYLTDTNVAILERELVECKHPVCAAVEFGTESFKSTCLSIEAADVLLQQDTQQQQQHGVAGKDDGSNGCRVGGEDGLREEQERQGFAVAEKILSLINNETQKGLDMNRIVSLLKRELLQYYYALETAPHHTLVDLVNEYFINGSSPSDLPAYLDQGALVSYLLSRPPSFWTDLINKYILKAPSVTVCCLPSIQLAKALQEADQREAERVCKEIGDDELEALQSKLQEIKRRQKDPPPSELLCTVPIAAVENVNLNNPKVYSNFSLAPPAMTAAAAAAASPTITATLRKDLVLTQLNSIPSEFVTLRLCVRTPQDWGLKEKQHLQLLLNILFECDVIITKEEAQTLGLEEEVIAAGIAAAAEGAAAATTDRADDSNISVRIAHSCLTELLLKHITAYNIGIGVDGGSSVGTVSTSLYDIVSLTLAAPTANFKKMCILLGAVIKGVCIEEHRVSVQLKRQKKQLIRKKRSPHYLVVQLERSLWFSRKSTLNACGWGSSSNSTAAATTAVAAAQRGEGQTVSDSLSRVYRELFSAERMMLHLTADASKLPDGWQGLLKEKTLLTTSGDPTTPTSLPHFNNPRDSSPHQILNIRLAAADKVLRTTAASGATASEKVAATAAVATRAVCGIGSSTASHVYLSVEAPEGFDNPDLPGLLVLCECCSMMEGLLFRSIRGAGYAYGCDLSYSPNTGQLTLKLSPATDPVAAVQAALSCMVPFASGDSEFAEAEIEAAKCGVIFSIVSREETAVEQSLQSLLSVLRGLPLDENKRLLRKVGLVEKATVHALAVKYLSRFIEAFGKGEQKEAPKETEAPEQHQRGCSTLCLITNKDKVSSVVSGLKAISIDCFSLPSKCLFKFLQAETNISLSAAQQMPTEEAESEIRSEDEGESEEGDGEEGGDSSDEDSDDGSSMQEE